MMIDQNFGAKPLTEAEQIILGADQTFIEKVVRSLAEADQTAPMSAEDAISWFQSL